MSFDVSKFNAPKARALPVILMLDRSSSMAGQKIDTLNKAVNEMIKSFAAEGQEVDIQVCVISFGGDGATVDMPLTSARELRDLALITSGCTPMGAALKTAKRIIEDKSTIPSSGFRPTVVLVSDGMPNDEWEEPLTDFIKDGRSSKCERFAMAIGTDKDDPVLNMFLEGTKNEVFLAEEAANIQKFFRFVTMSVSVKSRTQGKSLKALSSMETKTIDKTVDDIAKEFGF